LTLVPNQELLPANDMSACLAATDLFKTPNKLINTVTTAVDPVVSGAASAAAAAIGGRRLMA
jgi:hypothetical protein